MINSDKQRRRIESLGKKLHPKTGQVGCEDTEDKAFQIGWREPKWRGSEAAGSELSNSRDQYSN